MLSEPLFTNAEREEREMGRGKRGEGRGGKGTTRRAPKGEKNHRGEALVEGRQWRWQRSQITTDRHTSVSARSKGAGVRGRHNTRHVTPRHTPRHTLRHITALLHSTWLLGSLPAQLLLLREVRRRTPALHPATKRRRGRAWRQRGHRSRVLADVRYRHRVRLRSDGAGGSSSVSTAAAATATPSR